ncbi:S1C family serine protease [Haloplasma contractile]|uniref:Serine protease protein n=1 Tax=Haloplasma contractile SSD-17B TaxID=1033810 RepID=U2EB48_9MOLU|nr:trypsin-like peptidase domain-containing protein [Haloplasma contractile]ERJ12328.1 Serine protease protein [Haloplasma contractile SSD-17B]
MRKFTILFLAIVFGITVGGSSVYLFFTNDYLASYAPTLTAHKNRLYTVSINSSVSESIDHAAPNVVGIVNYSGDKQVGTGSGVIYKLTDDYAYIVTNQHVINEGTRYEVMFNNEEVVEGELIGEDLITDLAVVRIKKGTIDHRITFADSDAIKVGDFVVAIGNPLGLYGTSTLGIVSSTGRLVPIDINRDGDDDWYAQVLQTDAAINPGNSGGALVDLKGNLVGINSMKIASSEVEGIGFSIPTNLVKRITLDIERYGKVIRPYLGVRLVSLTSLTDAERTSANIVDAENGVYIIDVVENSSAEQQGLRTGDVITQVDGEAVLDNSHFKLKLYSYEVGDLVTFTVLRGEKEIRLEFELEADKVQ